MMVCLDTTFVIDILKNNKEAILLKEKLENNKETITIAAPSIIESIRGLNSLHVKPNEEAEIINFINSTITLPLNKKSALKAGYIELDLIKTGNIIDLEDIMIAAIAISNNQILITRNEKHFNRIQGLKIETY